MAVYFGDKDRVYPSNLSSRPPDYRKERKSKFFSTASSDEHSPYNPEILIYYADTTEDQVVRIEERVRTSGSTISIWTQTISGSNYSQQWPNYNHYVVYNPWEYSTYSG